MIPPAMAQPVTSTTEGMSQKEMAPSKGKCKEKADGNTLFAYFLPAASSLALVTTQEPRVRWRNLTPAITPVRVKKGSTKGSATNGSPAVFQGPLFKWMAQEETADGSNACLLRPGIL